MQSPISWFDKMAVIHLSEMTLCWNGERGDDVNTILCRGELIHSGGPSDLLSQTGSLENNGL